MCTKLSLSMIRPYMCTKVSQYDQTLYVHPDISLSMIRPYMCTKISLSMIGPYMCSNISKYDQNHQTLYVH